MNSLCIATDIFIYLEREREKESRDDDKNMAVHLTNNTANINPWKQFLFPVVVQYCFCSVSHHIQSIHLNTRVTSSLLPNHTYFPPLTRNCNLNVTSCHIKEYFFQIPTVECVLVAFRTIVWLQMRGTWSIAISQMLNLIITHLVDTMLSET